MRRTRHWCWSADRKKYEISYQREVWKASPLPASRPEARDNEDCPQATLNGDASIVAQFSVPSRPQLFGKPKPVILSMTRIALMEDEIFLILVFIYSEVKRQEETVRGYHPE